MSDRLLDRYMGRRPAGDGESDSLSEADGHEDLGGGVGWLRGPRDRAIMLELRKKDGTVVAVPYAFIDRIEFNPSEGITIRCGLEKIRIKGRNLNAEIRPEVRLFLGLTRHRVPWIQEADASSLLRADTRSVVVESIEC